MLELGLISSLLCLGFIAVGWHVQDFSKANREEDFNRGMEIPCRKVVVSSTKALRVSKPVKKVKCPGPSIRTDVEPLGDSVAGIEPNRGK